MSVLQVLAVGDSPSLAFLAWRLSVSQMCQISLVWRGSKISPNNSCQISFASEKFGNAKFTPAFAGNSIGEVLAQSPARPLDYVLVSPTSLKQLTSLYKSIDSSFISSNTVFIIDASFYTVGLEQILRRTFTKNLVLTVICEAELRKTEPNSFVHLGNNFRTIIGIPGDFAAVGSYVDMANYFKSILESLALDVAITQDYLKYQWSRAIPFLAFEFLSVILESPLPGMLQKELLARPLIVGIVNELSQIATAQGCPLFDDIMNYIDDETARFSQSYSLAGGDVDTARSTKPLSFLHSPVLFYNMYNSFDIPIDVLLLQPILMADDFQIKTPYLESLFTFLGRMLKIVSGESLLFSRRSENVSSLGGQIKDLNGGNNVSSVDDNALKEREAELLQREMKLYKREQYLQKLEQDVKFATTASASTPSLDPKNVRGPGGYGSSNSVSRLQASPSPQFQSNQYGGVSPNGPDEANADADPEDDDFLVERAPPPLSQDQINGLDMMSMTNRRQRRRVSQGRHQSPPSGNNLARYAQTDPRTETLPGGTVLDLASSDRYGTLSTHNLNTYSRTNSMSFPPSPAGNGTSGSTNMNTGVGSTYHDSHSSAGLPFPNMPSVPRRSSSGFLTSPYTSGRGSGVPGNLLNDPINAAAMSLGGNNSYLSSTRPGTNNLKSNGGSSAFGQILGNGNGNANGHINGSGNGNGLGSGSGNTSVGSINGFMNGNTSRSSLGGSNLYSQTPIHSSGSVNNAEDSSREPDSQANGNGNSYSNANDNSYSNANGNAYSNANGNAYSNANGNNISNTNGNAYENPNDNVNGSANINANGSMGTTNPPASAPVSAPASGGKKFSGMFRKKKK
ncbi:hypothetical protein NADFUDRAFT_44852 [Nadsonia fulvescens var. elongata DSM 6958]|uniref:Ketopantoate reductase C-terminal domain-containing protein n=1 Tax=Nadsonia fulvescens var. elongata DSM 6958 TaxID=857566 RepID=A0A1E3PS24_9ASCO|nr:hypothetical protein NADFUDRAFT_44852 [Nadsonia fulvescens var. elongata DSM 6958]